QSSVNFHKSLFINRLMAINLTPMRECPCRAAWSEKMLKSPSSLAVKRLGGDLFSRTTRLSGTLRPT
ncbi:MAG: hypothetical protein ACKVJU_23580, partial [Verrucomicrobiales bacterium]